MVYQKNGFWIVMTNLLLLLTACEKKQNDYYFVRVITQVPYNKKPITGLKYKVVEYAYKKKINPFKFGEDVPTEWQQEGVSNKNGVAEIKFSRPNNKKNSYGLSFDYSNMVCPYPECEIVNANPGAGISKNQASIIYQNVLPILNITTNFKNVNCTGSSDSFRFKIKNIDDFGSLNWDFPWSESPIYQGCCNVSYTNYKKGGRYVIRWEAERGGVFESGIDTFLVSPEVSNTINMFW
jgi:hypothetical protein